MKTLILNIDFSPLSIVNVNRGLVLSLNNPAIKVLEYYNEVVKSENDSFELPCVLLYEKYVRPPVRKTISKKYVLARDKMICQYCGLHLDGKTASVDHVIPISKFKNKSDSNSWDNLVACCKKCNTKKGGRTPEEAFMKLLSKPKSPRGFMTVQKGPEIWRKYVSTMQDTELADQT